MEVIRGPLQGVQWILLRKDKRHRLVLGIRLIQQAAADTARDMREQRDWLVRPIQFIWFIRFVSLGDTK
ncbi:MAG: hypothetical protein CAF45_007460 [Nitrospira sp. CG24E]|nr:MAG: hypothetical protein CAF45_007460 [Nitrospira sp. CG24E]